MNGRRLPAGRFRSRLFSYSCGRAFIGGSDTGGGSTVAAGGGVGIGIDEAAGNAAGAGIPAMVGIGGGAGGTSMAGGTRRGKGAAGPPGSAAGRGRVLRGTPAGRRVPVEVVGLARACCGCELAVRTAAGWLGIALYAAGWTPGAIAPDGGIGCDAPVCMMPFGFAVPGAGAAVVGAPGLLGKSVLALFLVT